MVAVGFDPRRFHIVVAGLVPATHVFLSRRSQDVDARHKAGYDELVA
jgi:hypothetical protein